jgi:hypothetical protein
MTAFFDLTNIFLWLGIIWAVFFGWRSVYIFIEKEIYAKKHWDWWLYQIVFNAAGAFVGWVALYYLWKNDLHELGTKHFVALIIAFLGITGNLPYISRIGKLPGQG